MQSLYNKKDDLEAFLERETFQAVGITESFLSQDKLESFKLEGYQIATAYCRTEHNMEVCV